MGRQLIVGVVLCAPVLGGFMASATLMALMLGHEWQYIFIATLTYAIIHVRNHTSACSGMGPMKLLSSWGVQLWLRMDYNISSATLCWVLC